MAVNRYFLRRQSYLPQPKSAFIAGLSCRYCVFVSSTDPTQHFSEWSHKKEWVCLAFRGAAKSTIESAYIAQVVLAFSDVRILFVGATFPKAEVTVDAVRQNLNYNPIVAHFWPDAAHIPNGKSFTVPTRTNTRYEKKR